MLDGIAHVTMRHVYRIHIYVYTGTYIHVEVKRFAAVVEIYGCIPLLLGRFGTFPLWEISTKLWDWGCSLRHSGLTSPFESSQLPGSLRAGGS